LFFIQSAPFEPTDNGGGSVNIVGGLGWLQHVGTNALSTGGQMYLTNVAAIVTSNLTTTLAFDIAGGTNGVPYDVFAAAPLYGPKLTNSQWVWLGSGQTRNSYILTNQPNAYAYYVLGTPKDSDGDFLTDAFELLVSKTDSNDSDTDGDGMPDGWEWEHFGNFAQTAAGDFDGDGVSNIDEYSNGVDPNKIQFAIKYTNQYVSVATPPLQLKVSNGVPWSQAVVIDGTNLAAAPWSAYSSNFTVNLGSTEGWHDVWVGLRGHSPRSWQTWHKLRLNYDHTAPSVVLASPSTNTTSRSILQVQGYAPEPLARLSYSITNSFGLLANQTATITRSYFDTNLIARTTNWFQCYDLDLAEGSNFVTLNATDKAGNQTNLQFNIVLDYSGDSTPPALNLIWPKPGMQLSGTNFTLRGQLDDPTASVVATIVNTNGQSNTVTGTVARDGVLWVENIPLSPGTNSITLAMTDGAENTATTNFNIVGSSSHLVITPIADGVLTAPPITVTGSIDSTNYTVWVNGIKATLNTNGTWSAESVFYADGGVAVIQARAVPNSDNGGNGTTNLTAHPNAIDPGNPSSDPSLSFDAEIDPEIAPYIRLRSIDANQTWQNQVVDPPDPNSLWTSTVKEHWGWGEFCYEDLTSSGTLNNQPYNEHYRLSFPWDILPPAGAYGSGSELWEANGLVLIDRTVPPGDPSIWWPYYEIVLMQETDDHFASKNVSSGQTSSYHVSIKLDGEHELVTPGTGRAHNQHLYTFHGGGATFRNIHGSDSDISYTDEIPSTEISVAPLGRLDADGNMTVNLADNTVLPLRTTAEGYPAYAAGVSIAYAGKLIITANGTNLATNTPEFCMGQRVELTASWDPPLPEGVQMNISWVASDDFINRIDAPSGGGSPGYVNVAGLMTNNPLSLWWYSDGEKRISCYASRSPTNGQNASISASGKISMYRPAVTFTDSPPAWATNATISGTPSLSLGNGNGGDMSFEVRVTSKFAGRADITQLVNRVAANGNTTGDTIGFELDNTRFHVSATSNPNSTPQVYADVPKPLFFNDGPCFELAHTIFNNTTSIYDKFSDYVLFRPDAGTASSNIYVTLGIVTSSTNISWAWSAATTYSGGSWPAPTYSITRPTGVTPANLFPFWLRTHSN
jgi:hypothetical protein